MFATHHLKVIFQPKHCIFYLSFATNRKLFHEIIPGHFFAV
jgi:hypothetical protein